VHYWGATSACTNNTSTVTPPHTHYAHRNYIALCTSNAVSGLTEVQRYRQSAHGSSASVSSQSACDLSTQSEHSPQTTRPNQQTRMTRAGATRTEQSAVTFAPLLQMPCSPFHLCVLGYKFRVTAFLEKICTIAKTILPRVWIFWKSAFRNNGVSSQTTRDLVFPRKDANIFNFVRMHRVGQKYHSTIQKNIVTLCTSTIQDPKKSFDFTFCFSRSKKVKRWLVWHRWKDKSPDFLTSRDRRPNFFHKRASNAWYVPSAATTGRYTSCEVLQSISTNPSQWCDPLSIRVKGHRGLFAHLNLQGCAPSERLHYIVASLPLAGECWACMRSPCEICNLSSRYWALFLNTQVRNNVCWCGVLCRKMSKASIAHFDQGNYGIDPRDTDTPDNWVMPNFYFFVF